MNKALTDVNLSDKEFRLLYLIVNNMSMNDTNEIEMYNGFIMDKLNMCERQVQRVTKSLVDKGYITKVITGTKANKNANVIRLNDDTKGDMNSDKSCDKNVTPYKNKKEIKTRNNNTSTIRNHEVEVTGASAHGVSSSLIEEEIDHAAGSSLTDDTPTEQADVIPTSSNDDLSAADRLTLSQSLEESTPPSSAAPPLMEWMDGIKRQIRKGIYDWSLSLTDDDVQTDDANRIVSDVLRNNPDWELYKGQFSILDLTSDTKSMMENRVRNLDVQAMIKENRYQHRHREFRKELSA